MKKVLAISLALILLVCFAACGGNTSKVEAYEGELSAVIASIYEKQPVEFMTCEAMPVELSDPWSVNAYLGFPVDENTTDGSIIKTGLKEAYFSESMIGAQAYSLVVARVEDADKIEEIKTICWCGAAAKCNARYNRNGIVREGSQVMLGANDSYIALCRKHFKEGNLGPDWNLLN